MTDHTSFKNAIHLYGTNEEVGEHNFKKLRELNKPIAKNKCKKFKQCG